MSQRPFDLMGRQMVPGGVRLLLQCMTCNREVRLLVRDNDELKERYPIRCDCGAEVNLFFGSPKVGRLLIEALKRSEPSPLNN